MLKFGRIKTMKIVSLLALFLPVLTCSCPNGWGELPSKNCYYIGTDLNSFLEADRQCRNLSPNAHLISIHNAFDNQLIKDELNKNSTIAEPWIGLENLAGGPYEWIDGSLMNYVKWCPGFPLGSDNHCVKFTRSGCWVNADCSELSAFVCGTVGGEEQPPTTTTAVTRTSPTATEVTEACNSGFTLMEDGYCYYASDIYMTFDNANSDCQKRGAHLVSMHSYWENLIAVKFLLYAHEVLHWRAYFLIWIGLQCHNTSLSSCRWTDGSRFDYSALYYGEGSYWGFMYIYTPLRGRWSIQPGSYEFPFIFVVPETSDNQLPNCNIGYWSADSNTTCYGFESVYQYVWNYCDACCVQIGGRCASIHNQQQNSDIYALFQTTQPPSDITYGFHIGLKENGTTWYWVDGTPYDNSFWMPGYPLHGQTPYVSAATNGSWATAITQLSNNICPTAEYFGMGEIRSPGFPENYAFNRTCTYTLYDQITVNPENPNWTRRTKLAVYFITFVTHNQDVVEIFDGPNVNSPLIASVSGTAGAKQEYYSTGYNMTIRFISRVGNGYKGWRAVFGPYTTRP